MQRDMICSADKVSDVMFAFTQQKEMVGSTVKVGVELTPYELSLDPLFCATNFKMYAEHERVKGELILKCERIKEVQSRLHPLVNGILLFVDDRFQGKESFARIVILNTDFYEIHNFVKKGDHYESMIKFILKGVRPHDRNIIKVSRTTKLWCKRLKVNIYEPDREE